MIRALQMVFFTALVGVFALSFIGTLSFAIQATNLAGYYYVNHQRCAHGDSACGTQVITLDIYHTCPTDPHAPIQCTL